MTRVRVASSCALVNSSRRCKIPRWRAYRRRQMESRSTASKLPYCSSLSHMFNNLVKFGIFYGWSRVQTLPPGCVHSSLIIFKLPLTFLVITGVIFKKLWHFTAVVWRVKRWVVVERHSALMWRRFISKCWYRQFYNCLNYSISNMFCSEYLFRILFGTSFS